MPLEVRPLICRLHPLTYTEEGIAGVSPGCPAELLPEGAGLLPAIGISAAQGEPWRAQLHEELRQDAMAPPEPAEAAGWDRDALEVDADPPDLSSPLQDLLSVDPWADAGRRV